DLQVRSQFSVYLAPRVRCQFVAAPQCILYQTGQFWRGRSAKMNSDCGILHERVVFLPRPELLRGQGKWCLTDNECARHAVAEALHHRTTEYRNPSSQIGEWQGIKNAHQIPYPRLFNP